MTKTRTKEILEAYIALLEPAVKGGRLHTPVVMFDAVMEAAQNPAAFSGDAEAAASLESPAEAGLPLVSSAEARGALSAEHTGRINDTGCRKQPDGDQS